MWSRETTGDEKKALERLSTLRGTSVDYSDPDAPRTDATRDVYRGQPSFARSKHEDISVTV
jgi:hypothetical protein